MKKTYSQKILNYLVNDVEYFDKFVAKRKFKKVENIHNTVMRTARQMEQNGLLKRVSPGTFSLTQRGWKEAAQ